MSGLKIIILQAFWYFSIRFGNNYYLPILGFGLFFIDFYIFKHKNFLNKYYLLFSFLLIVFGFCLDKVFELLGIFQWGDQFYPTHLIGIWFIFPCYYYQIFNKFSSVLISFVTGAIFGPIAYISGGNINSIFRINLDGLTLILLGFGWGVFFSLSIFSFRKFISPKLV